ncbi:hypothetical protein GWK47_029972 [Chionoecetes opilio]|uniref:Uncharacterized protein n=1 Tax=Chionoecetes opilio TaxID=41210 RepID=A0A8J4YXQ5_CHIOP|nr:hypothetical protein GWK47_029972 [Chionoecetes opilio]
MPVASESPARSDGVAPWPRCERRVTYPDLCPRRIEPTMTMTRVYHHSSSTGSVRSEDQQAAARGKDWTTVVKGRAAPPKVQAGKPGGPRPVPTWPPTALEDENPTLRMEVRPNLYGEYILTPRTRSLWRSLGPASLTRTIGCSSLDPM